ncbi:hypothetical protein EWM64_g822 [Hericium alpestre]|uniref:Uncharacterized protein n=1 Tax=Hericium alpestre TaxID=135208 RepID=A0A4Z0A7X5_9AGAM|nr:hypothetical protein EWM64_g822 [Hericium alpestre]
MPAPCLSRRAGRELPKKPTQISFTRNEQTILVSDKFGDIFSYPLISEPAAPQKDATKPEELASHGNPSGGRLILGHTSLLTAFALTEDEKFIVSTDRDEHVRVSWYPQGYCIESYCLGHKKFVSAVHIPSFAPETLISGGGDPALKIWDWKSGHLLREIPVIDAVMPFIAVRVKKRKWRDEEEEDGEEKKPRGQKGRGKNKGKQKSAEATSDAGDAEVEVTEAVVEVTEQDEGVDTGGQDRQVSETLGVSQPPKEPVFVLKKIDTVELADVETPSPILSTLNASRISATPTELSALELYDALASMPKNIDASHNPMDRDAPPESGRKFPHQRKGAKEMGKMKTRKAILEAQGTREGTADVTEEREVKKARSEGGEESVL